jgi:hypothetical protein
MEIGQMQLERKYEGSNKKDVRAGSYFGYLEYVVNR